MGRALRDSGFAVVVLVVLSCFPLSGYGREQDDPAFDYSSYADVLRTYVDESGMVNYRGLKAKPEGLRSYVKAIATLPRPRYQGWDDDAKIAFWLNAYNGLTLQAIIDHYPIKAFFLRSRVYPKNSIRQIPGVWDKLKFTVMGRKVTLNHIEHKILRVEFNETRIHMALVCAALGCPTLRNEPYLGPQLGEQLDDQTRKFLADRRKFRVDRGKRTVLLSPIFKWFGKDFVKTYAPARKVGKQSRSNAAVQNFLARYLEGADQRDVRNKVFKVKHLGYDWSLNEQRG